jgi:hypothetical protein
VHKSLWVIVGQLAQREHVQAEVGVAVGVGEPDVEFL